MPQFPHHRNFAALTASPTPLPPTRRANSRKLRLQRRLVLAPRSPEIVTTQISSPPHRRYIRSRPIAPMHLQKIRPRPHPDSAAAPHIGNLAACRSRIQPRPTSARATQSHPLPQSIASEQTRLIACPTTSRPSREIPATGVFQSISTPAASSHTLNQLRVQRHAPHPHPGVTRESRCDIASAPDKSHAAHRLSLVRANARRPNPSAPQPSPAFQPFAARSSSIGHLRTVRHHHAKTLLPRRNRSRKSRWTSANHKHASFAQSFRLLFTKA